LSKGGCVLVNFEKGFAKNKGASALLVFVSNIESFLIFESAPINP
jgi:hypothetical protein